MSDTGDRIKLRRKELGISADVLAKKLGVSRSTIFRYENGDIEKLPAGSLNKIAKILSTTPAYLMGWEESFQRLHEYCTKLSEMQIIDSFRKLNDHNKQKAINYTKKLLSIQEMDTEQSNLLNAAHERTDIISTPEGQAHDDAIMDDDSGWE